MAQGLRARIAAKETWNRVRRRQVASCDLPGKVGSTRVQNLKGALVDKDTVAGPAGDLAQDTLVDEHLDGLVGGRVSDPDTG